MLARLALLGFLLAACKAGVLVDDSPVDSPPPEDDFDVDNDGFQANTEDCDDSDPAVNPGMSETPYNGLDDDCDPTSPDDDLDGDGYLQADDCADDDPARHPDAIEACDDVDQDCDGEVDESAGDLWYADLDEDGYGDPATGQQGCEAGAGYVADATDCNDRIATVYPGAPEVCDELDNNCDGVTDEGVTTIWYQDLDGDGHGDPAFTAESCDAPTGYAATATDCDDSDGAVSPDAPELCNGLDDDCDTQTDEPESIDAATWYADGDGDGYGDPGNASRACTQPSGAVADASDCDDSDATLNPNTVWYLDYDGDGYGDPALSQTQCAQPTRFLRDATDCDDRDATQNPAAAELCNGEDDDCDQLIDTDDPDGPTSATWYADDDGDGYGDPGAATSGCDQPTGTVVDSSDCDDAEASANPGAVEQRDGLDNDCDGQGYDGVYAPTSSTSLATGVWEFTTFDVPAGVTVTALGGSALEVLVLGEATIDGTLDLAGANGQGHGAFASSARLGGAGGAGGGDGGDGACYNTSTGARAGGGASGGGAATSGSAGAGGGGGGAVLAGTDGAFGYCTQARCGNTNTWAGGLGGPALGGSGPQLLAGSGGGGGGWGVADNGDGGGGGGGGGALYLEALRLDVGGLVDCSGGDGGGDPGGYDGGSGGGGSGGTLWLVADTLNVTGTLACTGGIGGSTVVGGSTARGGSGGAGADGAIWVDAASLSLTGTIQPAAQAVP